MDWNWFSQEEIFSFGSTIILTNIQWFFYQISCDMIYKCPHIILSWNQFSFI